MLAAMLFLLTGCRTGSVFDGSRVSDASGFRMEYSILNREESAGLNLTEGDRLQVSLSHTEGTVDVTVGMNGKEPIYRGNIFPFRDIRQKEILLSSGFPEGRNDAGEKNRGTADCLREILSYPPAVRSREGRVFLPCGI
jgi:hypothetical protein